MHEPNDAPSYTNDHDYWDELIIFYAPQERNPCWWPERIEGWYLRRYLALKIEASLKSNVASGNFKLMVSQFQSPVWHGYLGFNTSSRPSTKWSTWVVSC